MEVQVFSWEFMQFVIVMTGFVAVIWMMASDFYEDRINAMKRKIDFYESHYCLEYPEEEEI